MIKLLSKRMTIAYMNSTSNQRKLVSYTITGVKRWSCQVKELPCMNMSCITPSSANLLIQPYRKLRQSTYTILTIHFSQAHCPTTSYGIHEPSVSCRPRRDMGRGAGGMTSTYWPPPAKESTKRSQERGKGGGMSRL